MSVHKIIQPFMKRDEKGKYIDTRTFAKGKNQCNSKNPKGRQCSLEKGHEGNHEHWQPFPDVSEDLFINGGEYKPLGTHPQVKAEHHEPWELGSRIRVWGD